MPASKLVLTATKTEGVAFNILREKAFILIRDLPSGGSVRLEIMDPDGDWVDISEGSGVLFDASDFNAAATEPGSLKFFYAAPGQNYRLVASAAGGKAWLLYSDPIPGVHE